MKSKLTEMFTRIKLFPYQMNNDIYINELYNRIFDNIQNEDRQEINSKLNNYYHT